MALAIVAALMLLATLFYPFGYDQAVFSVAGEMILHGAIPYRDFLDTKPPLVYYIYAVALWIFGHHEWSPHAFDILWQSVTAYYFFRALRRYFPLDISLVSVSLSLMLYAGSGFWMTAQSESFGVLPSVIILDTTLRATDERSGTTFWGVLGGAATGVLFALKFTLAFGGLASLLYVLALSGSGKAKKVQFSIGYVCGASVLLVLGGSALWLAGVGLRFLQSLGWLAQYASLVPSQHSWVVELAVIFPERIVYSTSVSVAVLALLGLLLWIRGRERVEGAGALLRLLLVTFVFQLVGIALERKIEFPYQYARAVWAITPFAAVGLMLGLRKYVSCANARRILLSAVTVLVILVLSPLQRIATQTIPWAWIAITGQNAAAEVQKRVPDYYAEEEHEVAAYLAPRMTRREDFFFWGNDAGIYFTADRLPQTLCLTATPLRTAFTPSEWKEVLLEQLTARPPKYWLVEFGDARPYITGSSLDSYRALLAWPNFARLLSTNFVLDTTIGHFMVFREK